MIFLCRMIAYKLTYSVYLFSYCVVVCTMFVCCLLLTLFAHAHHRIFQTFFQAKRKKKQRNHFMIMIFDSTAGFSINSGVFVDISHTHTNTLHFEEVFVFFFWFLEWGKSNVFDRTAIKSLWCLFV